MYENNQDAAPALQQLTFNLAGEEYGVDILAVREIRGWSRVTRIPRVRIRRRCLRSPATRMSPCRLAGTTAFPSGCRSWAARSARASYSAMRSPTNKQRVTIIRRSSSAPRRSDPNRWRQTDVFWRACCLVRR